MGIMLSPGVLSREIDKSNIIPTIATTTAAIVGGSPKGDTTQIRLITNTQQFIEMYGEPVVGNYFHYSALAFLENGNQLYCLRVVNGALYGGANIKTSASAQANAVTSVGRATPQFVAISGEDDLFTVYGKDPGVWNNNLGVKITNVDAINYTFDIVVYLLNTDGSYSLMETWTVSRKNQLDGYGRQQYLQDMINGFSDYIVVADNNIYADTVMPKGQSAVLALAHGSNGSTPTDGQKVLAWDRFINPDVVDVRLLIGGGETSVTVQQELKLIAETRKDCIALLDMPYAQLTSVDSQITWRNSTQNFNSSYSALYSPWVKMFDPYNGKILEIPPSGYVASQIAYNDYVAEPWYAPAGTNRGILNVLGLTNIYTQGERDALYSAGINPIQTFRARGNVIWGQKTQQVKASALDRINVRRSLIIIEKAITIGLLDFVFEPNSERTRLKAKSMIEEYLDILSAKGAFQTETNPKGYVVVCDATNNTPAIIDRNELNVDIYIQPSRSAEFIHLNTIIVNTSATFNELVARGVQF